MAQFDEFTISQKKYAVFADDIAAAHSVHTNRIRVPLPHLSFPAVRNRHRCFPCPAHEIRDPPGST